MSVIYGIDLGTTYTKCAVVRPGNLLPEVVPLDTVADHESALLRSAVTVTTLGTRFLAHVGAASWTKFAAWNPADVASPMCRRFEETKLWIGEDPSRVIGEPPPWTFEPHNNWGYRPEDIGALVLLRVKKEVERRRLPPLTRIVVTHPQNFSEARREATRHAVRLAGLEVVDTISEPDAAVLAFGINQKPGLYMVFDIGGGTLDVVILRVKSKEEGGGSEIVTSDGKHVGGRRWDDAIYDHIVSSYEHFPPDFSPEYMPDRLRQLWLARAESMKRELCTTDKNEVWELFRFVNDGVSAPGDSEIRLTRARFEEITSHLVDDCCTTADIVLQNAGKSWFDLSGVLMVGGSSRIGALRDRLAAHGLPVHVEAEPDTVVVRGAALHAQALLETNDLTQNRRYFSIVNHHGALSRGLGILACVSGSDDKIVVNMVPKDSRLPFENTRRFTTTQANQTTLELELWEGEDSDPSLCVPIGVCVLKGLKPGPHGTSVSVRVELRRNGEKVIKLISEGGEVEAPILFDERAVLNAGVLVQRRAFLEKIEVV